MLRLITVTESSHLFLEDRRIRVIRNTVNSGSAFKQWNRGVREARGEYVWIAEADDSAEPTLLSRLVPLLDQNPQVGIAYCQSMEVMARVASSVLSTTGPPI